MEAFEDGQRSDINIVLISDVMGMLGRADSSVGNLDVVSKRGSTDQRGYELCTSRYRAVVKVAAYHPAA